MSNSIRRHILLLRTGNDAVTVFVSLTFHLKTSYLMTMLEEVSESSLDRWVRSSGKESGQ